MLPNNPFSMVAFIVLVVFAFGFAKSYMKAKHASRGQEDSGLDDELRATIMRMEDRIAVLERIVTDSGYDLKREIDRL